VLPATSARSAPRLHRTNLYHRVVDIGANGHQTDDNIVHAYDCLNTL
jgi:hypothetical protein